MSKSRIVEMECPKCGKKQKFEVHDSINVTLDPDLSDKLLDGSIFNIKCDSCGYEESTLYPILYNNMEKKYMIQLCPPEEVDHYKEMFNVGNEMMAKQFSISDDYKYRIVSNLNDLLEKIFIFNEDLDDRIIELMKLDVLDELEDDNVEKILFSPGKECVFVLIGENKVLGTVPVLEESYEVNTGIFNMYKKEEDDKEYIIDDEWAVKLFTNEKNDMGS